MIKLSPCHDCGVQHGQIHKVGCDMERCPVCGTQAILCHKHCYKGFDRHGVPIPYKSFLERQRIAYSSPGDLSEIYQECYREAMLDELERAMRWFLEQLDEKRKRN